MRSLWALLVIVAAIAVLTAGGRGSAQVASNRATLDVTCDGTPIPSGVDAATLCTFRAVNRGQAPLDRLHLVLAAAPNLSIPDRYYFFSATRDEQEISIAPSDLEYAFADLAPGSASVIKLLILVRSTHAYGADAMLVRRAEVASSPDEILDTELIVGNVTSAVPGGLKIALDSIPRGGVGGEAPPTEGLLTVENTTDAAMTRITLQLAYGAGAGLDSIGRDGASAPWRRRKGMAELGIELLEPHQTLRWSLRFHSITPATGDCGFVVPAVIALNGGGGGGGGGVKISETSIAFGDCSASGLPQGGFGPDAPSQAARSLAPCS